MEIYDYVEIIWRILITPNYCITYMIMKKNYSGGPVNIYIKSLINIIQEKSWLITTKNGKGKFPLFCGGVERVITVYAMH